MLFSDSLSAGIRAIAQRSDVIEFYSFSEGVDVLVLELECYGC